MRKRVKTSQQRQVQVRAVGCIHIQVALPTQRRQRGDSPRRSARPAPPQRGCASWSCGGGSTRDPPALTGATSPLTRRGAAKNIQRTKWFSEAPLPGRRRGEKPALLAAMPSDQPKGDCVVACPPSQSSTSARMCFLRSASRRCWPAASSLCHCVRPQRSASSRGKSSAGRSVAKRFSGSLARSPATCAVRGEGGRRRGSGRAAGSTDTRRG